MRRVRDPAGRSREMFCRPVLPSGKAKVRFLTSIVGEGIFANCCWVSRLFAFLGEFVDVSR